ncbi:chromosomal replication initiator protein DnaA [Haliovirga abyssi]|uniref:Chromosomal replication initiator protein DnaA n=1 Tax=Haliovirga abyssi TaxID=2996794 RepID=A0AAU9DDQ5_9FUSO|nr:chromosomal replication initiator protein DnaA [Haliovirga abyssi]BDU49432.1 chromosomal replication initiator protein DnaA [Haliovirga abyssi]
MEEMNAVEVWKRILKILKWNINETDYNSWMLNVKPIDLTEDKLILEVDNKFIKDRIESKFKEKIIEILNEILILKGYKDLEFRIKENEDNKLFFQKEEEPIKQEKKESKQSKQYKIQQNLFSKGYYNLNDKYLFNNFIVGKSNEFAHAASEAVANAPGKVYNPLFIYGGVGLGKTHLMHAIGNSVLKNNSNKKVYYCSSEQFTNDLINSLKNDKMMEFRSKYRKLDLLLIDDIQFIAGKDSTQEEFFHTFNELHQAGKQIVLSSDRPPKEIDNVEKRLVSRFEWGLIADIQQPDYETRVAILSKKAEMENIKISKEVLEFIAETINSNIRELEGNLNRIVAKASILKKEINIDLVKDVFYDVVKRNNKVVNKDKIIKVVSEYYEISIEDMISSKRKKDIAKSRQVAMYLLRDILSESFSAIGGIFGGKDHTTVMHSVSKIEKDMKENKYFEKDIMSLKEKILNNSN